MNKSRHKKQILFNLYSQNLEWVKEHPSIFFKPDFSNGYLCPLCFDVFFQKDLDNTSLNPLTLEDIPPVSLGGKPLTLTCKKCNSISGHELDVHLLNRLLEIDTQMFLPNSKSKATFELNGNKVNGMFEVEKNGRLKFDIQSHRSNPIQAEKFSKEMFPPRTTYNPLFYPRQFIEPEYRTPPITMKYNKISNERRAEIALLRIAYLIAFSTLGNGFLINSGLFHVREQIQNPDKEILPKVFWIKYDFPTELEGVNIISLPKELQCYLVVFNLRTASQTRQFAIALPGPTKPSIKIYNYITEELCHGDGKTFFNATVEHIPKKDYLRSKEHAFIGNLYWQEYTKEDYKPRPKPKTNTE